MGCPPQTAHSAYLEILAILWFHSIEFDSYYYADNVAEGTTKTNKLFIFFIITTQQIVDSLLSLVNYSNGSWHANFQLNQTEDVELPDVSK